MKFALKAISLTLGVLALTGAALGFWHLRTSGALITAADLRVADPTAAVRDARQLIERFRLLASPDSRNQVLPPSQLPQSLRLPELRHALVYRDRINLVLGRNPDWSIGARVWTTDSTTVHADQTTQYPDIFFFQYSNDLPVSPSNFP